MRLLFAASLLALVACSTKPSGTDAGQTDARMDVSVDMGVDIRTDTPIDMTVDTTMDMTADMRADTIMDTAEDTSADQVARACEGTPCCVFADPGLASTHCNVRACIPPDDAGTGSAADADPSGCTGCQNGYACAIVCSSPSPDAGCAPSLCCFVQ